jgi:hypothetical protein
MTAPAEYKFLSVELDVNRGDADEFEALMRELLPVLFEKAPDPTSRRRDGLNWRLLSSIRTGNRRLHYLHLWQVPRDVSLLDAMLIVGKNSRYYVLNQLSLSERQDLFNAAVTYSPLEGGGNDAATQGRLALMTQPDSTVIVETASGPADWFTLHEWQDAMPVLARDVEREDGLRLVFALQAESGQLRRYINFWRLNAPRREVTEAQARNAITKRNIKLSELGVARHRAVATPADEPGYYLVPYDEIVASSFQVYKEVGYR